MLNNNEGRMNKIYGTSEEDIARCAGKEEILRMHRSRTCGKEEATSQFRFTRENLENDQKWGKCVLLLTIIPAKFHKHVTKNWQPCKVFRQHITTRTHQEMR